MPVFVLAAAINFTGAIIYQTHSSALPVLWYALFFNQRLDKNKKTVERLSKATLRKSYICVSRRLCGWVNATAVKRLRNVTHSIALIRRAFEKWKVENISRCFIYILNEMKSNNSEMWSRWRVPWYNVYNEIDLRDLTSTEMSVSMKLIVH